MRTKALLLAAAFAAAGVSTSVAQVYSVNAVGYVNVSLYPGFNMVSNPLNAGTGNNTVAKLFSNITGGVPAQLKVWTWDENAGTYNVAATYVSPTLGFQPPTSAGLELLPGRGAFVQNPQPAGSAPLTLTFVGEVPQGNLSNPLPVGFSIKASQVPQAAKPEDLGLVGAPLDKIYRYDGAAGAYRIANTFANATVGWQPPTGVIAVGEAFFYQRHPNNGAGTWTRTFSVNG
jgi:hypothetical protein